MPKHFYYESKRLALSYRSLIRTFLNACLCFCRIWLCIGLESENWWNWVDFEAAWRMRFGDPDYQYALRDEIFRRTQVAVDNNLLLTCLRALFSRMSPPWPIAEQLNLAHRNMLPRLQIAIRRTEFADFPTLEYLATRVERSFLAEKNYRPPLPPE